MKDNYLNDKLSPEERAKDLLAKMSIEEKMAQVNCLFWEHQDMEKTLKNGIGQVSTLEFRALKTMDQVAEAQREIQNKIMESSPHKVPAVFHMEGLCGPFIQGTRSFPSGIGRASGWDAALEEKIGEVVGRQERALGITQTFAPVLDVSRDSRMGRQCETYGEDPTLASALGASYVKGVQKKSSGRQTDAMAKHFLAFHDSLGAIHGAEVEIGERRLREVYGKPFQAAIKESKLRGIMPCYCTLNGKPASASREILTELLREEMGFDGVVGSDYSAIANVHHVQRLGETMEEAGLSCMEAGLDVELPNSCGYCDELGKMFADGRADIKILDQAVLRILTAKFRMGLFESPLALIGEELKNEVDRPEDEEITLQSARQSMVLLKNKNHVLPISKKMKKIALIGCHADNARFFFGGYTQLSMVEAIYAAKNSLAGVDADNHEEKTMETVPGTQIQVDETDEFHAILNWLHPGCRSLRDEISLRLPDTEILYAYGYHKAGEDTSYFEEALKAAAEADIILLTLGGKNGSGSIASMGEGVDGTDINLPRGQELFLLEAAKLGKPMVGIHMDGRPISSDIADQYLDAILEAWNPSEKGAQAITDVLLGEYNPSGKLPLSVAYGAGQSSLFYGHMNGSSWHQGGSIGFPEYVDMPHTPRYDFGYGLSYTAFSYFGLQLNKKNVLPSDTLEISLYVKNVGEAAGEEVVQLYVRDLYASMARPVKELAGFCRVCLEAGEEKKITFAMPVSQTAFLDQEMKWKIEKGQIEVQIGASSEDIRLQDCYEIMEDGYTDSASRSFWAQVK